MQSLFDKNSSTNFWRLSRGQIITMSLCDERREYLSFDIKYIENTQIFRQDLMLVCVLNPLLLTIKKLKKIYEFLRVEGLSAALALAICILAFFGRVLPVPKRDSEIWCDPIIRIIPLFLRRVRLFPFRF